MREGAKFELDKDEEPNANIIVDWNDNPNDVMEAVNWEIQRYGLEVVVHETDGDYYAFSIQPIKQD